MSSKAAVNQVCRSQSPLDLSEYRRIKEDVNEHQEAALSLFGKFDRVMTRLAYPLALLSAAYLSAQIIRAIMRGWLQ